MCVGIYVYTDVQHSSAVLKSLMASSGMICGSGVVTFGVVAGEPTTVGVAAFSVLLSLLFFASTETTTSFSFFFSSSFSFSSFSLLSSFEDCTTTTAAAAAGSCSVVAGLAGSVSDGAVDDIL